MSVSVVAYGLYTEIGHRLNHPATNRNSHCIHIVAHTSSREDILIDDNITGIGLVGNDKIDTIVIQGKKSRYRVRNTDRQAAFLFNILNHVPLANLALMLPEDRVINAYPIAGEDNKSRFFVTVTVRYRQTEGQPVPSPEEMKRNGLARQTTGEYLRTIPVILEVLPATSQIIEGSQRVQTAIRLKSTQSSLSGTQKALLPVTIPLDILTFPIQMLFMGSPKK